MDLMKNYTEVLIDGKVYAIGGAEDANYIQKVASYVSRKRGELRRQPGFLKQKEDYQALMVEINMADDYFKAQEKADSCKRQKEEANRDIYGIKHELINTQMKLEEAQSRIEELEKALREKEQKLKQAVKQAEELEKVEQERVLAKQQVARLEQMLAKQQEAKRERILTQPQEAEPESMIAPFQEVKLESISVQPQEAEPVESQEAGLELVIEEQQETEPEWKSAQEETAVADISDGQKSPTVAEDPAERNERLRMKEELEKQKALQAARVASEQFFKSRAMQGRNHQTKK